MPLATLVSLAFLLLDWLQFLSSETFFSKIQMLKSPILGQTLPPL